MLSKTFRAHLALAALNIMYGMNYLVAKGLMPNRIEPSALAILRIGGAAFFFSLITITTREKIAKKDWPRLILCGIFGLGINPLCSMNGLNLTSPVDASIIMTATPLLTLIFGAYILKEPITKQRMLGIFLGALGAILLTYLSAKDNNNRATALGNIIIGGSATSFALYLVLVKPLLQKYQVFTIISWVFLFGFLFALPIGTPQLIATDFGVFSTQNWMSLIYTIIFPTILANLLNVFALQYVRPATSGSYIYAQPVIAMILVAVMGYFVANSYQGEITTAKLACSILVFAGVYLISTKKKQQSISKTI